MKRPSAALSASVNLLHVFWGLPVFHFPSAPDIKAHPRRQNVTTFIVQLKNGHMRKNLTQNDVPQRYSWEHRRRRSKGMLDYTWRIFFFQEYGQKSPTFSFSSDRQDSPVLLSSTELNAGFNISKHCDISPCIVWAQSNQTEVHWLTSQNLLQCGVKLFIN